MNDSHQKFILFVWLLLLSFSALHAEADTGISVLLNTPSLVETQAGQSVTTSFLITNTTNERRLFVSRLELPEGWRTIPAERSPFFLDPQQSCVQITALCPPLYCGAGTYPICLNVWAEDDPRITTTAEFDIKILSHVRIASQLEEVPLFACAGESYQVRLRLVNTGNIPMPLCIEATDIEGFPIRVLPEASLYLAPKESGEVVIWVDTDCALEEVIKHFLRICVFSPGQAMEEQVHSTLVEIFPAVKPLNIPYRYLPVTSTIGYGMKDGRKQLFFETEGHGVLNEERCQEIDFYFRVPIFQQAEIERDFGGFPGRGYLHFSDQCIDAYGGDGLYCLTPLTMLNLFGKGGSVDLSFPPFEAGALYVQDTSSVPLIDKGGYIAFAPSPFFQLSASYLHVHFNSLTANQLQVEQDSSLYSLGGQFEKPNLMTLDLEYAAMENLFNNDEEERAFFAASTGRPCGTLSYAFQAIHAGENFTGYYRDLDQQNASVSFPIFDSLRGYGAFNYLKTNLSENPEKNAANRSLYAWCGLSYPFPWGMYSSLGYNWVRSRDTLSNHGYETHYLNLLLSEVWGRWTFQGQFELGHFHNRFDIGVTEPVDSSHRWENLQAYLYCYVLPFLRISSYSRLGFMTFENIVHWQNTYGTSINWQLGPCFCATALYEYTRLNHLSDLQFVNASIDLTLPNGHQLGGTGFWRKCSDQTSIYEFLMTYTIPWRLPLGRDRACAGLRGKVFSQEQASARPLPHLVINCNGCRALTNTHGEFALPQLPPGEYSLWVEQGLNDLIPLYPLPQNLQLAGGKITEFNIPFVTSSKVSGEIALYKFDMCGDVLAEEEGIIREEEMSNYLAYREVRGWSNALIRLYSPEYNILLEQLTDMQGRFCFDKLPPGKWKLLISISDLPPYHQLSQKELEFEITEKQEKHYTFRILPIPRHLRMIDKGTL